MKKIYQLFLTLFLVLFFLGFLNLKPVYASTEVYKITDAFQAPPPALFGVNYSYYNTYITLNYKGGDIIISKNPDGTGDANIGDILQIGRLDGTPPYNIRTASWDCRTNSLLPPTYINSYFSDHKTTYVLQIRLLDACGNAKSFSSLYMVVKNIPDPTPSITNTPVPTKLPTATPTATPSPTGPQPFLELPWDYHSKGLSFNEAALSMTSFFDHTYPLLSATTEPEAFANQITTFENENSATKNYSSHDGYDYSRKSNVIIGDAVLAAAGGTARYVESCAACGNMIVIDHHNGYQTRYMHLQKTDLIIDDPSKTVEVTQNQKIGLVGATGRVIPEGTSGAHLHFMVIEDKNHDGNFDDNIPDGITDPYGWQSSEADPWSSYKFTLSGQEKFGNTSSYLWKTPIDSLKTSITSAGGTIKNGTFTFSFPKNTVDKDLTLELRSSPILSHEFLDSLGPTIIAVMKDGLGTFIHQLNQPFTITVDFNGKDINQYKPDSLFIYSSEDGKTWNKEETKIDMESKKATTEVNHFSRFALMAEKKDTIAPETEIALSGTKDTDGTYISQVKVSLIADEGKEGTYTLYSFDKQNWEMYKDPLIIKKEGNFIIYYYSVDTSDNVEDFKQSTFTISSLQPEAHIFFDTHLKKIVFHPLQESVNTATSLYQGIQNYVFTFDSLVTSLSVQNIDHGAVSKAVINTIRYNDSLPFQIADAAVKVVYEFDEKKNTFKVFNQMLTLNDIEKVKLIYLPNANKTLVNVVEDGKEHLLETLDGLKTLFISTHKGKIEYSY